MCLCNRLIKVPPACNPFDIDGPTDLDRLNEDLDETAVARHGQLSVAKGALSTFIITLIPNSQRAAPPHNGDGSAVPPKKRQAAAAKAGDGVCGYMGAVEKIAKITKQKLGEKIANEDDCDSPPSSVRSMEPGHSECMYIAEDSPPSPVRSMEPGHSECMYIAGDSPPSPVRSIETQLELYLQAMEDEEYDGPSTSAQAAQRKSLQQSRPQSLPQSLPQQAPANAETIRDVLAIHDRIVQISFDGVYTNSKTSYSREEDVLRGCGYNKAGTGTEPHRKVLIFMWALLIGLSELYNLVQCTLQKFSDIH
uniref:Uncharacterized protein n=1 Tax=Glossina pallidipes TaxID=7398 RepID=A0A1B0A5M4_GLOPL